MFASIPSWGPLLHRLIASDSEQLGCTVVESLIPLMIGLPTFQSSCVRVRVVVGSSACDVHRCVIAVRRKGDQALNLRDRYTLDQGLLLSGSAILFLLLQSRLHVPWFSLSTPEFSCTDPSVTDLRIVG